MMRLLPMPPECRIYSSPVEVRAKLNEMDIPQSVLKRAAQSGFVERANANIFDPVTAAGWDAWRYPTREVRQALSLSGWRLENPNNLPLVISDERKIILTVSSGDECTGGAFGKHPKTKNSKGSVLKAVIEKDFSQPNLFGDPAERKKFIQTMDYPIWVFLLHITDENIQAELSSPLSFDGNQQIGECNERIILDILPPNGLFEDDQEPDTGPDIVPTVDIRI